MTEPSAATLKARLRADLTTAMKARDTLTTGTLRLALAGLAGEARTMVFFESVHRLTEALTAMVTAFGADRPAALCRELTKTYEEVRRGTLGELVAMAEAGVRGEVTLVVGGATEPVEAATDEALAVAVAELVAAGGSRRDAVDAVAARYGIARRVVYAAATRR